MSARNFREATSPHEFREAFVSACPRFRGFRQHDSHEFLRYFLDQMHVEMKKCKHLPEMPEDVTPVARYFEGILQSRVICQECNHWSNKNDEMMGEWKEVSLFAIFPFPDLSLDIPRVTKRRISLSDCLDTFFMKEILEKNEKPTCGKCKTKQTSSKQMFIKKLPEVGWFLAIWFKKSLFQVLCLHIKRFRDSGHKMDTLIEFPMTGLSVDDFLTEVSWGFDRLFNKNFRSASLRKETWALCNESKFSEKTFSTRKNLYISRTATSRHASMICSRSLSTSATAAARVTTSHTENAWAMPGGSSTTRSSNPLIRDSSPSKEPTFYCTRRCRGSREPSADSLGTSDISCDVLSFYFVLFILFGYISRFLSYIFSRQVFNSFCRNFEIFLWKSVIFPVPTWVFLHFFVFLVLLLMFYDSYSSLQHFQPSYSLTHVRFHNYWFFLINSF